MTQPYQPYLPFITTPVAPGYVSPVPPPRESVRPVAEAPPRVRVWVRRVLEIKPAIERAIQAPIGRLLGCGYWGCVFDSTPPWVVKLTIDPTEGPIWYRIQRVFEQQGGGDGLVRVRTLVDLRPGVTYGGRRRRLFAIVREAIDPIFSYPPRREMAAGIGPKFTRRTKRELGVADQYDLGVFRGVPGIGVMTERGPVSVSRGVVPALDDFERFILELQSYRNNALAWHSGVYAKQAVAPALRNAIARMYSSRFGGDVAESLDVLLQNNVVLRDVHLQNIGWRAYAEAPGFEPANPHSIVIFDPGHTPTERRVPIEQRAVDERLQNELEWWGEMR